MELQDIIINKNILELRKFVKKTPLSKTVQLIEHYEMSKQLIFFRLLKTKDAAKIFSSLNIKYQKKLVQEFSSDETIKIFDKLYADDLVDILEEIPANISKMIIEHSSKEKRTIINKLLKYHEDSVGSIMSVDMIILKKTWTCKRALLEIKRKRSKNETSSFYYVKNTQGGLVGSIKIEDLVFAKQSTLISQILTVVEPVITHDSVEHASWSFKEQDFSSLPVLNSEGILVGMITSDDIIDAMEEVVSEDIQKMAGIDPIENPYFSTSIIKIVRSRIFWLMFLMISATISQIVLDVFMGISARTFGENTSKTAITATITTMLVTVIPVISGSAGNAGAQASTVVTRGLAIKEITINDHFRIIWREFRVGVIVGTLLGGANFLRLIFYYLVKEHGQVSDIEWWIAFGSSLSLILVITISKLVGGLLPLLAKLFKQDPAVMAAPLITTLTDALSSVLFFSINIAILILVLRP